MDNHVTRLALESPGAVLDPGPGRPTTRRNLLVIFNPMAGPRRRRRLAAMLRALEACGCRIALRATAAAGDAQRLAREGTAEGFDAIVVAGGDGTINEAVNGLAASGPGPAPPLALLPLGTANVLATEIGLPATPAALAQAIATGPAAAVTLGSANGRCFAMMAGAGFDAHVVAGVDPRRKRLLGKGAYIAESLAQLRRFPYPRYRVTIDGVAHEAASVIVARGRHYGGRYICAPEASLALPVFQIVLFGGSGAANAARYGLALVSGRLAQQSDIHILRGRRVAIEGPPGDPVQGDGDIIARLPVAIDLAPRPIALVMPTLCTLPGEPR